MIYALKVVEFLVVIVFATALSGAWYKLKGGFGGKSTLDRIELSIVGLLSVSTLIHFINLFR